MANADEKHFDTSPQTSHSVISTAVTSQTLSPRIFSPISLPPRTTTFITSTHINGLLSPSLNSSPLLPPDTPLTPITPFPSLAQVSVDGALGSLQGLLSGVPKDNPKPSATESITTAAKALEEALTLATPRRSKLNRLYFTRYSSASNNPTSNDIHHLRHSIAIDECLLRDLEDSSMSERERVRERSRLLEGCAEKLMKLHRHTKNIDDLERALEYFRAAEEVPDGYANENRSTVEGLGVCGIMEIEGERDADEDVRLL